MSELAFTVLGRPQGKGSKRVLPVRTRAAVGQPRVVMVDSNRNAAPWAARVAAAAIEAADADGFELIRGPVTVQFEFCFSRPRAHFGTGRNVARLRLSAPEHMAVMPDVDKLTRCALDALTGVIFKDDAQVVRLQAAKRWSEPERLEARVRAL